MLTVRPILMPINIDKRTISVVACVLGGQLSNALKSDNNVATHVASRTNVCVVHTVMKPCNVKIITLHVCMWLSNDNCMASKQYS